ncbi:hypothetical protein [Phenylobacterium sp. LjRoot164]|uniref:hypothetical protein n=1 Tax=Phenylobacterium sp. LjRoot164 TaxID=3342272 RepID=UPI003ECFD127
MSAYERESLVIDRAANRIAEAANTISSAQRDYAFWQLVLGAVAVAFTGIAAFFAYRATHWAKEAARQSKRSADADNAALEEAQKALLLSHEDAAVQADRFDQQISLARTNAVRELRAYLSNAVKDQFDIAVGSHARVVIQIMNTGRTPAYHFLQMAAYNIVPANHPGLDIPLNFPDGQEGSVLNPGDPSFIDIQLPMPLSEEEVALIHGEDYFLYLWGRVVFVDAFDQPRELRYRYRLGGKEMMRVGMMHLDRHGQYAN